MFVCSRLFGIKELPGSGQGSGYGRNLDSKTTLSGETNNAVLISFLKFIVLVTTSLGVFSVIKRLLTSQVNVALGLSIN